MGKKNKIKENYLGAWAYLPPYYKDKLEALRVERKIYENIDMENYIEYLFINTMFYNQIEEFEGEQLPVLNEIIYDEYASEESVENINKPKKWLDFHILPKVENRDKKTCFLHLEKDDTAVMNTGLLDEKGNEIFMIFGRNKNKKHCEPWYFKDFKSLKDKPLNEISLSILPQKVNLLTDINYIIFDSSKLNNWDNRDKINWDDAHIFIDRKDRILTSLIKNGFIVFSIGKVLTEGFLEKIDVLDNKVMVTEEKYTIAEKEDDYIISEYIPNESKKISEKIEGQFDIKIKEAKKKTVAQEYSEDTLLYVILKEDDINKNILDFPLYNLKDILYDGVKDACVFSKYNYKLAIPYIYLKRKPNVVLVRGFLLPVKFEERICLTVAVNYQNDRYYINTILTLDDAKKSADIVCITDENWLYAATKGKDDEKRKKRIE